MPSLDDLIADLTSGDDARAEASIAPLLAHRPGLYARLQPLLAGSAVDARWWALRVLAACDDPPPGWFAAALGDPEADIRQCAVLGLCHHPDPSALSALAAALDDPDSLVASLASNALVALGAQAVPALIDAMQSPSQRTRLEAARALNSLQDPRAIPALMKAVQDDSAVIQYWAGEALNRLGLGMVYLKPE